MNLELCNPKIPGQSDLYFMENQEFSRKKKFYTESELVFESKPNRKKFVDLDDMSFGKLSVLGFAGHSSDAYWYCKCSCLNIVKVRSSSIRAGLITSCGCYSKLCTTQRNSKHDCAVRGSVTTTYRVWLGMKSRCNNPNNMNYYRYGAVGIKVCDSWNHSFENFLKDMGERPDGLTLERKENSKGYFKDNCRWATPKEQANNRKSNRLVTFDGKTKSIAQWAEEYSLRYTVLRGRIKSGWDMGDALNKPPRIR